MAHLHTCRLHINSKLVSFHSPLVSRRPIPRTSLCPFLTLRIPQICRLLSPHPIPHLYRLTSPLLQCARDPTLHHAAATSSVNRTTAVPSQRQLRDIHVKVGRLNLLILTLVLHKTIPTKDFKETIITVAILTMSPVVRGATPPTLM